MATTVCWPYYDTIIIKNLSKNGAKIDQFYFDNLMQFHFIDILITYSYFQSIQKCHRFSTLDGDIWIQIDIAMKGKIKSNSSN